MKYQKLRTVARTLIATLICCGAMAWSWRRAAESNRAPTTSDWVRSLRSESLDERKLAIQNLQELDPAEIGVVVPALLQALEDADPSIRLDAALSLAKQVSTSAPVYQTKFKDQPRSVATRLLEMLEQDNDVSVRGVAASALASISRAVGKAGISSDSSLTSDPLDPKTLVAAYDDALDRDPSNRMALLAALVNLGTMPLPAPPAVLAALDDPNSHVRGKALESVSHFSTGVDRAVPILLKDLAENYDRFPPNYLEIARDLHSSPAVVPILIKTLENKDGLVREASAVLLARVEPAPRAAGPALIASVKKAIAVGDTSQEAEADSGSAGPKGLAPGSGGRPAGPPPGSVTVDLARALARAAPTQEALPVLIQLLASANSGRRTAAAAGLAELGADAQSAIPALLANLKEAVASKDERSAAGSGVRLAGARIAEALGRIVPLAPAAPVPTKDVIAALRDALGSDSRFILASAAEALGNFGPAAASAVPRLHELTEHRNPAVKKAAEAALQKIEPDAKQTGKASS